MRQPHSKIMTSFVRAGLLGACLAFASAMSPAQAEETTGTAGSPSATTTIDGQQLPAPDPKFGGVIKDDALQSTPWWAPRIVPPKDAPNILLIITDDAGFGVPSTFGGVIPTPTMDRATQESSRRRCARRRVRRSSPGATITRRASA